MMARCILLAYMTWNGIYIGCDPDCVRDTDCFGKMI
jgi:hypothetical protein